MFTFIFNFFGCPCIKIFILLVNAVNLHFFEDATFHLYFQTGNRTMFFILTRLLRYSYGMKFTTRSAQFVAFSIVTCATVFTI